MKLVKEISDNQREWRNASYLTCRQSDLISEEHHKRWLERINQAGTDTIMFGLAINNEGLPGGFGVYNDEPLIVGTVGLTYCDPDHGKAEYSILIAPKYRGRGYAKEGLKLLIDHAFEHYGWLNRFEGEIFCNNPAALHVAEACGFKQEGTLRERYYKDGKYIDSVMVSILRSEWSAK